MQGGRPNDVSSLEARVAELEGQVRELELKKAILEETVELLGKDTGANPATVRLVTGAGLFASHFNDPCVYDAFMPSPIQDSSTRKELQFFVYADALPEL